MMVESFTTTPQTPTEIHAIGQAEATRIMGEMMAVVARANVTGASTFEQYFDALLSDPNQFASTGFFFTFAWFSGGCEYWVEGKREGGLPHIVVVRAIWESGLLK